MNFGYQADAQELWRTPLNGLVFILIGELLSSYLTVATGFPA